MDHRFSTRQATRALLALIASATAACDFEPPLPAGAPPEDQIHAAIAEAPLLTLNDASRYTVFDDPGRMKLMHGMGCAYPQVAAGKKFVGFRVQESASIPFGYKAAVFLNGHRADHLDGDRNLMGLGAAIVNVETNADAGQLRWEAGGVLSDASGNDPFKWCYWYGLVMWNPEAPGLDIDVFQTDAQPALTTFTHKNDSDPGNSSAVRELPGMFEAGVRRKPRAVLPRGFGLMYSDGNDYNLLQAGFDLGLPRTDGTVIKWNAQTVLKDDDDRRDYRGTALISVLMGESTHVWQPEKVLVRDASHPNSPWNEQVVEEFKLEPRRPHNCSFDDYQYHKHEYLIEDVPFDYALPMLSGWDNGNACGDTNVENIGVWITEVYYEKTPGAPGKLRYTVASLFDDDGGWWGSKGSLSHQRVVVLGFNALNTDGN